jgi:hypothetical protein
VISRIQKGGLIDRWELSNFIFSLIILYETQNLHTMQLNA